MKKEFVIVDQRWACGHVDTNPTLFYDRTEREAEVRAILDRGNIAVFTQGKLVKKVNKWETEPDFPDDLIAFESNGSVRSVCFLAIGYTLTEEVPESITPDCKKPEQPE